MVNSEFSILFWGVRGSTPSISKDTIEFGGNTPCIQINAGKHLLIIDAGTGLCQLGKKLMEQKENISAHIFISHTHWDHVQGIPFFLPFYEKENQFKIYGEIKNNIPFSQVIKSLMKPPYFPVTWDTIKADCSFYEISQGDVIFLDNDLVVKTLRLNHPDDALGFRIEFQGKSCCYISDIEHKEIADPQILQFIENTDVLIYDASFTEEEYIHKKGWGHSTWEKGIELTQQASAKKLILFHHDTYRYDEELASIETQAQKIYPNTFAAKEGMELHL
ncbi:MAG: MBL fold metallo-hydrolase [Marinisporobacter sp.]|jgi:phosphoribosyl 1,2-cyclic phosphodiesterase|nr:MBL fold metallo-hydrolase [Marinisporobacter sp.]